MYPVSGHDRIKAFMYVLNREILFRTAHPYVKISTVILIRTMRPWVIYISACCIS